ncbi:MAG: hypothetical protein QNL04_10710 [SAR324 cluster bacterium]|nr:hypothetical protein [SAR324 cluster bacterium]
MLAEMIEFFRGYPESGWINVAAAFGLMYFVFFVLGPFGKKDEAGSDILGDGGDD